MMRFRYGFYGLICLLGLFLLFQPTVLSGLRLIPGDPGDGRLNHYFLEHTYQLIANRAYQGSLFSPLFFFPESNTLAYSENLFGSAPLYWLFRAFTHPDNAFGLWAMGVSVLNFAAMVYVLRRFQVQPVLASLGGFLMAFSLNRVIRMNHAQLLPQFCTPLALLSVWQFWQQPTRLRLIAVLGFSYWQVLCSIYLGWFLLLGLGVTLLLMGLFLPDRIKPVLIFLRQHWRFSGVALLSWGSGLGLLFWPYLNAQKTLGVRSYAEVMSMLPRLESWLVVPDTGTFWSAILRPFRAGIPVLNEHSIFLGMTVYGLILGAIVGVVSHRFSWLNDPSRRPVLVFLGSGLILFGLSLLLPGNLSAWAWVYRIVPGAGAMRAVTRIFTLITIYGLLAGLISLNAYLAHPPKRHPRRVRAFGLALLLSFVVLEQHGLSGTYDKLETRPLQQELVEILRPNCQLAYYEFSAQPAPPTPVGYAYSLWPWTYGQMIIMWAGITANVPVINAYTGGIPPGFPTYGESWPVAKSLSWVNQKQFFQQGNFCHIQDWPSQGEQQIEPMPKHDRFPDSPAWQYQKTIFSANSASRHYQVHVFQRIEQATGGLPNRR